MLSMSMLRRRCNRFINALLILLIFAPLMVHAQFLGLPDKPTSPVIDLTETLSEQDIASLEQASFHLEQETSAQLQIAIINSLESQKIEAFSNKLFNHWQLGQAEINNGVLLLVAKADRKIRIEVGSGLESVITDGIAGEIINNYITPDFKRGRFDAGLAAGHAALTAIIQKQPLPEIAHNDLSLTPWSDLDTYLLATTLLAIAFGFIAHMQARHTSQKYWYLAISIGIGFMLGSGNKDMATTFLIFLPTAIAWWLLGYFFQKKIVAYSVLYFALSFLAVEIIHDWFAGYFFTLLIFIFIWPLLIIAGLIIYAAIVAPINSWEINRRAFALRLLCYFIFLAIATYLYQQFFATLDKPDKLVATIIMSLLSYGVWITTFFSHKTPAEKAIERRRKQRLRHNNYRSEGSSSSTWSGGGGSSSGGGASGDW